MPEQKKFHGRKPHTPGRAHKEGDTCPVGGTMYRRKETAEQASRRGRAKKCGRCKQWHPTD